MYLIDLNTNTYDSYRNTYRGITVYNVWFHTPSGSPNKRMRDREICGVLYAGRLKFVTCLVDGCPQYTEAWVKPHVSAMEVEGGISIGGTGTAI